MLAAPTLREVTSHSHEHPNALCCILFAPTFSKTAKEGVIPRIGYLNSRSAQDIHFYCAGYGGYWHESDVPDMERVGDVHYSGGTVIPWSFSQRIYSSFVNEIECTTTWKYSGEVEMIVLDPIVTFRDCLVFKIDQMLKDDAIGQSSELFEVLIRYASQRRGQATPIGFSDSRAAGVFGNAVLNALSEGYKSVAKTWKQGKHYAVTNLQK